MRRLCVRLSLSLVPILLWVFCVEAAVGATPQTPQLMAVRASGGGEVLREVVDPCLGLRWQLRDDPLHAGGPRRMVLLGRKPESVELKRAGSDVRRPQAEPAKIPQGKLVAAPAQFVIRAGEPILVDQESEQVHAQLPAVALESASAGQRIQARLRVGSSSEWSAPVIAVVAVRRGVARWASAGEAGR